MKGFRKAWLLSVALLFGCISERLSGTEVGNPEVTVSARFGFIEDERLARISNMEMMVIKMNYQLPADSMHSIWEYPAGMEVNLASPASAANLPTVKVPQAGWTKAELMLAASKGDFTLPDSISFSTFANPRFIKLVKNMNGDSVRFLFELPPDLHMKLRFDADRLLRWRNGNRISIEIVFDCARWTSVISNQSYLIRKDGEGMPYILLSLGENSEVHGKLNSLFPECFIADAAEML